MGWKSQGPRLLPASKDSRQGLLLQQLPQLRRAPASGSASKHQTTSEAPGLGDALSGVARCVGGGPGEKNDHLASSYHDLVNISPFLIGKSWKSIELNWEFSSFPFFDRMISETWFCRCPRYFIRKKRTDQRFPCLFPWNLWLSRCQKACMPKVTWFGSQAMIWYNLPWPAWIGLELLRPRSRCDVLLLVLYLVACFKEHRWFGDDTFLTTLGFGKNIRVFRRRHLCRK